MLNICVTLHLWCLQEDILEDLSLTSLWHFKTHYVNMIDWGAYLNHWGGQRGRADKLIQSECTFFELTIMMMQAVQSPWWPRYSVWMPVSVAFHYIILKDSCLLQHKYVPLYFPGVTAINFTLRNGCQIRCKGKRILKWMKWRGSRRCNRTLLSEGQDRW